MGLRQLCTFVSVAMATADVNMLIQTLEAREFHEMEHFGQEIQQDGACGSALLDAAVEGLRRFIRGHLFFLAPCSSEQPEKVVEHIRDAPRTGVPASLRLRFGGWGELEGDCSL